MLSGNTSMKLVLVAAGLLGLPVAVLALLSLSSRRPANLGAVDGFLRDCPSTPNCVCTQATRADQRVPPIEFTGSAEDAMAKLKAVLNEMPAAKIAAEENRYLHVECTSRLFRFVDDMEFLVDAERQVIHCRSASRVGRSDFGVNRRRVEAVRRAFLVK